MKLPRKEDLKVSAGLSKVSYISNHRSFLPVISSNVAMLWLHQKAAKLKVRERDYTDWLTGTAEVGAHQFHMTLWREGLILCLEDFEVHTDFLSSAAGHKSLYFNCWNFQLLSSVFAWTALLLLRRFIIRPPSHGFARWSVPEPEGSVFAPGCSASLSDCHRLCCGRNGDPQCRLQRLTGRLLHGGMVLLLRHVGHHLLPWCHPPL